MPAACVLMETSHRFRGGIRDGEIGYRDRGRGHIQTGSDNEGSFFYRTQGRATVADARVMVVTNTSRHVWDHCGLRSGHRCPDSRGTEPTCENKLRPIQVRCRYFCLINDRKWRSLLIPDWRSGFMHLAAGLSVGLAGLAAGYAIGIVGDMVWTSCSLHRSGAAADRASRVFGHTCNNHGYSWAWC